jgi:hypothetical protein
MWWSDICCGLSFWQNITSWITGPLLSNLELCFFSILSSEIEFDLINCSLLVGVHFTKQKPKKKKKKERKVQQTTQAENAKTESEAVKVENSEKNKNESFELGISKNSDSSSYSLCC